MSAPTSGRFWPRILAATVALTLLSVLPGPPRQDSRPWDPGTAELAAQELRPFGVDDALRIRSISIADATEDARWVAARITPRGSRFDTDHFRFGDPTYIAPGLNELVVIDTETGEQSAVFDGLGQSQGETWSGDGSLLAFRYLDGDRPVLGVHDRQGGTTRYLDPPDDREFAWGGALVWLPDGRHLLAPLRAPGWRERALQAYEAMEEGPVVVQDGGDDFLSWDAVRNLGRLAELSIVDAQTGAVTPLLEEAPYTTVEVSDDGSHLFYVIGQPLHTSYSRGEGTEYSYFRIPLGPGGLPVGDPETVTEGGERLKRLEVSPDGSSVAWADRGDLFVHPAGADSALKISENLRTPLSAADSTKRSFSLERWAPDGSSLLARAQDGWYLVAPDGSSSEHVWAIPGDTEEERSKAPARSVVQWTEDGRYLYATHSARDRWERGMVRLDLERGEDEVLFADANLYRSVSVARDGSRIVARVSDGDRPDDLVAWDGRAVGRRALTELNGFLDQVAMTRSELIEYLDVDGEKQFGVLYYPVDYEPGEAYPLVAEVYEEFFDNGYRESANLIAAQGWFMLRPSVGFEIGFPGEAWLKGVTAAVNDLIGKGMVDGDRLGIHGTSYGGYATNLIVTQTDRFAAAINISGKVNIISFLGDSEKITVRNYNAAEETQDRIGATLWEQPQKYIAHSAVMFADRVDTPLLLLTGQGDWNVPATNTREMYYALRRLEKEVVWVNYMRGGHGGGWASNEEDYRDQWRRIIDWYRTHFEEPPEREPVADGASAGGGLSP